MAREINLVPDVKDEMIKTLKLRNFIFFLCIVVAAVGVGATALVGLVMGGQQIAIDGKKSTITALSTKLKSYSDLDDFLTIKDQLGNISSLTNNKKVLSRTFDILSTLLPTGADTITISELNVNLAGEAPTFSFDAQADAGKEPYIDYNVLDSFKKSMKYMHYDYGNYVDKNGNTIPAYCMIESGSDGAIFRDDALNIYAYWTINEEGCNPAVTTSADSTDTSSSTSNTASATAGYTLEDYEGKQVVRIWRTPQFSKWYKENPKEGEPSISLDGQISNVPHFVSACVSYTGDNSKNPTWETSYNCNLVPGGDDGIVISDSSNGRGASDELVLRFSAVISLAPEVYSFTNHHVLAIPPSGRHNVTDSYVQVQAMFGERARDCGEGDTTCSSTDIPSDTNTNSSNSGSSSNNNSNSNGGNNG